jgi:hypothetical protein
VAIPDAPQNLQAEFLAGDRKSQQKDPISFNAQPTGMEHCHYQEQKRRLFLTPKSQSATVH